MATANIQTLLRSNLPPETTGTVLLFGTTSSADNILLFFRDGTTIYGNDIRDVK